MHAKSNPVRFRPATARVLAALASCLVLSASAGVMDDAKFKLDLRGDPNGNAYIDAGEVGSALDFSAASPLSAVYGGGNGQSSISASQYASQGTAKYGTLPYVSTVSTVNPYDGSSASRPCLVLPQSKKTENGTTSWAENGVMFSRGAVPCGSDGGLTIYARFKWDGTTTGPNLLVGNGWDGTWGNSDNGISVTLNGSGVVGVLHAGSNPGSSSVTVSTGVWYDLFVVNRSVTINGAAKTVSDVYLYKANAGASPTLTTGSITNAPMAFGSTKTKLTLGCYLLNSKGWGNSTNPRAFKGTIADVMIWDREVTAAEMAEVMRGSALGGAWQIGALNGSADEFTDADPAAVFEPQSMPWRQMRKTLDAGNPTLSIAATMTASERQMARVLTVTPVLSGASAPVEIALNGTAVGDIDLASETSITLPKRLWMHDGNANTIAITRTGTASGAIQFDAIALAPAPSSAAGTVFEDARFMLDLRGGESTYTKPGDLGNALDFSSASPLLGYMGDQRGPQTYSADYGLLTAQETAQVRNPCHPLTVTERRVLHFHQENPGATDATKGVRSGVVFPGAAPQGDVQTFYLRFRWDGAVAAATSSYPVYLLQSGNADNGNSSYGVAIMLESPTVGTDDTTTNVLVSCRIGRKDGNPSFISSGYQITSGEWNDLFVTFARNDGEDKFTTTWSICTTPAASGSGFAKAELKTKSTVADSHPQFNSSNLTLGTYHQSGHSEEYTRSFRGLISDFMVWDRALTPDEKRQVMTGSAGAKWFVGLPNGSADEFGDVSPAAVYEPESMPWHRMRKTLDASNRTLALKGPVAANNARTAKLLTISPILRGGAETACPVEVSVNGTSVGTYDLANPAKRCILIERARWMPDANDEATVTITRTGTVAGTLAIDHLSLAGTWMVGKDDGISSPMLNQANTQSSLGFVGDEAESHFTASVSVGAGRASIFFDAWIPDGAKAYDWRFATDIHSNYPNIDQGFSLFANGTKVGEEWTLPAGDNANEKNVWTLPAGTFAPGLNRLELKMTTPASGTGWAWLDYYRLRLVEPPSAFVLIVR